MPARVTEHARARGRERLSLGHSALQRTAEIVLRDGLWVDELTGALRRYCDDKLAGHPGKGNHLRIHGEQLYVFAGRTLITVWPLPHSFKGQLAKIRRQRAASLASAATLSTTPCHSTVPPSHHHLP